MSGHQEYKCSKCGYEWETLGSSDCPQCKAVFINKEAAKVNYSNIDDQDAEHLLKLIDFLVKEVSNAGGDGDALWYSKCYDVKDIKCVLEKYDSQFAKKYWKIDLNGQNLFYGEGQEGLLITNDEEKYKTSPHWQQILVKY